jgi:hypothetical protein
MLPCPKNIQFIGCREDASMLLLAIKKVVAEIRSVEVPFVWPLRVGVERTQPEECICHVTLCTGNPNSRNNARE